MDFLVYFIGFLITSPAFAKPEPAFTIGGFLFVNGEQIRSTDANFRDHTISLEVGGVQIATYTMGDIPAAGDYNLVVPMNSDCDVQTTNAGCTDDLANIFVNGVITNESPITLGAYGGYLTTPLTTSLFTDADEDGFTSDVDCDDNDAAVNPGVTEVVGNGGRRL